MKDMNESSEIKKTVCFKPSSFEIKKQTMALNFFVKGHNKNKTT
jgi:hypothetical protein